MDVTTTLTEQQAADLHAAGRAAADNNESRAPWLSSVVRAHIPEDTPVGSPLTHAVCNAFIRGYEEAVDEECRRILGFA